MTYVAPVSVAVTPADVRLLVLESLAEALERLELDADHLDGDFDLLAEGVVDSFGLLELLDELERSLGTALDFERADTDTLTTVGGLSRHVAAQLAGTEAAPAAPPPREPGAAASPPSRRRRSPGGAALGAYRGATRLRDKLFSLAVSGGFAAFGRHSVLQLPVRVKGERRIALGSGCFVGSGSWLQVLGDGAEAALTVGDGASIAGGCVLSAVESVRIGAGVSFARGVYVADHAHDYDGGSDVRSGGLTGVAAVDIGDGVWLGENVVVLPGARIGQRAVIGAGSIVSGEIPAYALALGAPARVVRRFGG